MAWARGRAKPSRAGATCVLLSAFACSSGADAEASAAFPNLRMQFSREDAALGYVANRFDDTVSVIDMETLELVGTAPVGRDPVVIDGPRRLVHARRTDAFYTVLSYPHEVVSPHVAEFGGAIRTGFVHMLDAADFRVMANQRASQRAFDLALSPDESRLAVIHHDTLRSLEGATLEERRSELLLVDGPSSMPDGFVTPTLVPGCVAPSAVEYDARGERIFVACTGEDSLGTFDGATGELRALTSTGDGNPNKPWCLSSSPDGSRLVVSNQGDDSLALFDVVDDPVLERVVLVGGVPFYVAWRSEHEVVVALQRPGGVQVVDVTTGEILHHYDLATADCENPSEPTLPSPDRLLVTCEGDHYDAGALVELDVDTGSVVARIGLGLYPERLVVAPP